jgi:hypothetical protein
MADAKVFQVRKVFDPKTFSIIEELVETGVQQVSVPKAPANDDPPTKVEAAPVKGIVAKVKAKRRSKKKPTA